MSADRWYADLPFRGTRTYVHSTSICNHLRPRLGAVARFELVMREWMTSRILFAPLDETPDAKATVRVDFPDGAVRRIGLTDDPAHPVTAREPYDEEGIVAAAPIADRVITLEDGGTEPFFDRLIAANKALITRSLEPGVKLIASKIVLDGFPADAQGFQLRFDSHLGTRLFRSSILIGGEPAGELVFYGQ